MQASRFPFLFERRYRLAALPFTITPGRAWVEVDDAELRVRFGPWSLRTPLANVTATARTGGYAFVRTAGPAHLSLADRGVTFATNARDGLCVSFAQPVRVLDPTGRLRHPAATMTVAEPDGLARLLETTGGRA